MMLIATCCLIASVARGPAAASPHMPWEPLLADPRSDVEIDRSRISREYGFAEIWVRLRGKPEAIAAEFIAAGVDADRVDRVRAEFLRSEHLWSFRCRDRSHALAYSAYYATDGSLISEFKVGQRAYWPVQPDTVGVRLLQAACGENHADAGDDGDEDGTAAAAPR
jgi:hypothetical protein